MFMENMNEWINESQVSTKTYTIDEVEGAIQKLIDQRAKYDEAKKASNAESAKVDELEMQMVEMLKSMGRKNFQGLGGTVSITHRTSVKTPKTDEEKKAFFEYLEQKNLFLKLASVNSQSLNSWYNEEHSNAVAEGRGADFSVPGIGEPTLTETLSLRKSK
jgi:hypothetical protein